LLLLVRAAVAGWFSGALFMLIRTLQRAQSACAQLLWDKRKKSLFN